MATFWGGGVIDDLGLSNVVDLLVLHQVGAFVLLPHTGDRFLCIPSPCQEGGAEGARPGTAAS